MSVSLHAGIMAGIPTSKSVSKIILNYINPHFSQLKYSTRLLLNI